MAQQQLMIARDLIREKRYAEARRLLVTIDHPKAREWLVKLDDVEARVAARTVEAPRPTPRSAETVEAPWIREQRAQSAQAWAAPPYGGQPAYGAAAIASDAVVEPEKRVTFLALLGAIIGGLLGAAAGAAIWAAIAYFTEMEVGYVALLVGALAGGGAVLFSGRRRGLLIVIIAILMSLLGIVVGKYAAQYAITVKDYNEQLGPDAVTEFMQDYPPLSIDTIRTFIQGYIEGSRTLIDSGDVRDVLLDGLFLILAVFAAWRIAASTRPKRSRQPTVVPA